MRQKLCRRLEELEKISVALNARLARRNPEHERVLAEIRQRTEAWHADPANQRWLTEQPPEYLGIQVRELRARLMEIASGGRRGLAA